jgi:shikimate kinase
MLKFKNFVEVHDIHEGVNDPAIFKAVFLAGGPGSGKSFIVGRTALTSLGFRVVNSDTAFETALDKAGLDKSKPEDIYSEIGQEIRGRAKTLTAKQQALYIKGRLGLVIDGTGRDYDKISGQRKMLEQLGYDTAMIFVNTDLETAVNRNRARARKLPDSEVERMWKDVQKNIGKFSNLFKANMHIVDNSNGADFQSGVMSTYRKISAWSKKEPADRRAKEWIKNERARMRRS